MRRRTNCLRLAEYCGFCFRSITLRVCVDNDYIVRKIEKRRIKVQYIECYLSVIMSASVRKRMSRGRSMQTSQDEEKPKSPVGESKSLASKSKQIVKRNRFSFEEKKRILEEAEILTSKAICHKYQINERTLCHWMSRKEEIIQISEKEVVKNFKKRSIGSEKFDEQLYAWVADTVLKGLPISGPIIKKQALVINRNVGGREDFKASNGWLEKWILRKNLKSLKVLDCLDFVMSDIKEEPLENPISQIIRRTNAVPIIYTRGTHYQIGFDIGRTFAKMIEEHVESYWPLTKTYLPLYETQEGRKVYEETLACVNKQFPQYVREIQGTADGSGVPFHKLFLMHLDEIITNAAGKGVHGCTEPIGCTAVICNQPGEEILGHTEDTLAVTIDHWYLVDAHVIEPEHPEEKFTSLSYAGFLPGYTMGYNHHGLVFSINSLYAKDTRSGKTPRYFLTRALLGVENYVQAQEILRNEGYGAAEGFAVNMTFLKQEGDRMFHNAEIAPVKAEETCSQLSVLTTSPGEHLYHCNKYMRLEVPEMEISSVVSSIHRNAAINRHRPPENVNDVIEILSDQTDDVFRIYRQPHPTDVCVTIATGIFDCVDKTWSIYTSKPNCSEPVVVLPLRLKDDRTQRKR